MSLSALLPPVDVVYTVGLVTMAILTFMLARFIWEFVRVFIVNRNGIDLRALGDWAVVTGATDGIGKEYAVQLARDYRLNVVLISRSIEKLNAVAKQIETESGVKTKCVVVDFGDGNEIYDRIRSAVEGLDVAVLVNNVGLSTPCHDFIHKHDSTMLASVVRVNCASPVVMTKLIVPGMLARKRGAIVNVGSISAYTNAGLISTYAATKCFVDRFSQMTNFEYNIMEKAGIIVQTLRCGFVRTKLGRWPRLGPMVPDAATHVRSAIKTIGITDVTSGWWAHELVLPFFVHTSLLPNWFMNAFMRMYQRIYLEYEH